MPKGLFGWLAEGVDFLGEVNAHRTPGGGLFNIQTMVVFGIEPPLRIRRFDVVTLKRYNAPI